MRDRIGHSLLTVAIYSRRERVVRFLLKHGANPNEEGKETPLIRAIGCKDIEIFELLLKFGAQVNLGIQNFSIPPLLYSVMKW